MRLGSASRWGTVFLAVPLVAALTVTSADGDAAPRRTAPQYDVIIRGGTVFDGTGAPGRRADVAIENGFISKIGHLGRAEANREYDASGLYVSPGFIDVHNHTEEGPALAAAKSQLTQGVTTATIGPDGFGEFAIADQLKRLRDEDKGINLAPYAGFNTVWGKVVGNKNVRPTDAQLAEMRGIFKRAMKQGAWGVSSGLEYPPATYTRTSEIIAGIGELAAWRSLYTSHIRNEAGRVIEAVNETIKIGRQTGLMPEVTHIKVAGPMGQGKSREALRTLAKARESGTPVGADVYPYTAASTWLSYYIPEWAHEGGNEAMLARFADPDLRARIARETTTFLRADTGKPECVSIPAVGNKSIADFMKEYGDVSVGEAIMRVLEHHGAEVSAVLHIMQTKDVRRFIKDPHIAISSDGGVSTSDKVHPRHYGTYPRFFGRFVRDKGWVSWADGIRKATALPATMIGLSDRGYLAPGMRADVAVFDPKKIIDKATFSKPRQYSKGVEWVFVNGDLALAEGEPTKAHAGEALRRSPAMPTRAMTTIDDRASMREAGSVTELDGRGSYRVLARAHQPSGAATAAGLIKLSGPNGRVFTATRLGRLQTADGWQSITGVGRSRDGAEHAFVLTIDHHDPTAPDGRARVTFTAEGGPHVYGDYEPLMHARGRS